jgi:hypothetical protein
VGVISKDCYAFITSAAGFIQEEMNLHDHDRDNLNSPLITVVFSSIISTFSFILQND